MKGLITMPKTLETTVYLYSELSENAKEKAANWFRETLDYEWYDSTQEDFHAFLDTIGFNDVSSQFSGFYSPGDGASFNYKGIDFNKLMNVQEADQGEYKALHDKWLETYKPLLKQAKRIANAISGYSSKTSYGYHYSHAKTRYATIELDCGGKAFKQLDQLCNRVEIAVTDLMQQLANKYYSQLEEEWDRLNSDEYIADGMAANEYTFLENGKRFG
jgi:hypothetical protein